MTNCLPTPITDDRIVLADTPLSDVEIDYDYIRNITEKLSNIINTSYNESSVYKFYTGYQSKINNTGSTDFKGYLLMQVQFYNETFEEWVVADDTVNETTPRTMLWADPTGGENQNMFALDTIFNGLVNTSSLSSFGNGTYRIYTALRDPDGNVLVCDDETELVATYEFTITF